MTRHLGKIVRNLGKVVRKLGISEIFGTLSEKIGKDSLEMTGQPLRSKSKFFPNLSH
jgi:hypothetical protein